MLDDDDIVRYVYNDQGQRVLKLQEDEEDNTAYVNPFFIVRGDDVHGCTNAGGTRMYRSSGHDGFYSKHVMIGSVRIASRLVAKDDVQGCTNVAGAGRAGAIDYDDDEDRATFFYHSDHLGSTGYVSDHSGKLAEHIAYFPFGESWIEQQRDEMCMDARMSRAQGSAGATMDDLSPEKWRFTGKELDSETGLYYFGARYYDPRTSVWQSADPILGEYLSVKGTSGGLISPINFALYAYSQHNPIVLVDPNGEAVFAVEFNKNSQYGTLALVWNGWLPDGFDRINSRSDAGGGVRSGIYPYTVGTHPIAGGASDGTFTDNGSAVVGLNLYDDFDRTNRSLPALPYNADGEESGREAYSGINAHPGNRMQFDENGSVRNRGPGAYTGSDSCITICWTKNQDTIFQSDNPDSWDNYQDFMSSFESGAEGVFYLARPGETSNWIREKYNQVIDSWSDE